MLQPPRGDLRWEKLHRAWHRRGYLPHFDMPNTVQMVTYRLADSLSPHRLEELRARYRPEERDLLLDAVDGELDTGSGKCWLRDPRIATIILENWRHFAGVRYQTLAWVVMPNHVHLVVLVLPGWPLSHTVHSWKSYTANQANRVLQRRGEFWDEDYFDRVVRDEQHLLHAVDYIHYNPVRAGLCKRAEDWEWSSYGELVAAARC